MITNREQTPNSIQNSKAARTAIHKNNTKFHSITIGVSPAKAYSFFRNFKNMTTFMKYVKEVSEISPTTSHWVLQLRPDVKVSWDTEITQDEPNRRISWHSIKNSKIETAGTISFEPGPQGKSTVVRMSLSYKLIGGKITELAAKAMGEDPETLMLTNLRRLKAYLETEEIPTVEGQPSGRESVKEEPQASQLH